MKSGTRAVALFGGAFNPPHLAHRQVLEALVNDGLFEAIWVVPSFSHPFEKSMASFQQRVALCKLLVEGLEEKGVSVNGIEGELQLHPSYTVDVLRELNQRHPDDLYFIVVGSDCREQLADWKGLPELQQRARFYFVPRPGFEESPFLPISSREVRARIEQGGDYRALLLPTVANYLEAHHLYGL